MVTDHRDLDVWKRSHQFTLDIYGATRGFPRDELYGLTSQLRRAAVAIPANLAEGGARQSRREFLQFCYIARGSASEIAYLLLVVKDLGILPSDEYEKLHEECQRISKMLSNLVKSLRTGKMSSFSINHSPFTIHYSLSLGSCSSARRKE